MLSHYNASPSTFQIFPYLSANDQKIVRVVRSCHPPEPSLEKQLPERPSVPQNGRLWRRTAVCGVYLAVCGRQCVLLLLNIMPKHAPIDRVLLHLSENLRVPIDPQKIYLLEADGDDTLIRTRGKHLKRDLRKLGELMRDFEPHGFLRIHRNYAVNLLRIREIARRKQGEGWQVRLQPAVNLVLPVGETHLANLWRAFGHGG